MHAGQKLLLINVPPGMKAGDELKVQVPGEKDRFITARVPAGGHAQFQIAYTPQHSTQSSSNYPPASNNYPPASTKTNTYPPYSFPATSAPTTTSASNNNNNNNNNMNFNPYSAATGRDYAQPSAAAPYNPAAAASPYAQPSAPPYNPSPMSSCDNNASSSNCYKPGSGPTHGVIAQANNPTQCHKVDYEIKGQEMQFVEVVLDPRETVIAEAGAMMFMEDDIDFQAKMGDGSNPKQGFWKSILSAGGRLLTGESLFLTHFTNQGTAGRRRVAFAAPYPGTIVPIDMAHINKTFAAASADKRPSIICEKDAFLCAAHGTKLTVHFHKRIGTGFFGGEGFILQKCKGDGMLFLHAGGCIEQRYLAQGERLRVDTGCLVAFTSPSIDYSIQLVKGLKSMFFGGEGLFLCTLTAVNGPGTVWLQSLPFSRLADRIIANAPSLGGRHTGEGTAINPLGGLLDGDGIGGGLGFGGF